MSFLNLLQLDPRRPEISPEVAAPLENGRGKFVQSHGTDTHVTNLRRPYN